ncbi:ribonuclease E/G [Hyphococcus sp. DH-69]|uniref:ribonuclease E/G n=1 Tax=Hyphococcus formosus TaxID=3143534 RepID=UPI00398A69D1
MSSHLIIECGVAQTRAALLQDDQVSQFWFGPARGDEAVDIEPREGRRFIGKISRIDNSLNAAFIALNDKQSGFLSIKPKFKDACVEGAFIEIEVKTPPRQEKGAELIFIDPCSDQKTIGRSEPIKDAAIEPFDALGADFDCITIDDGDAVQVLIKAGLKNIDHFSKPTSLFEAYELTQEFERALERKVELNNRGAIIIDEAQALTSIDVDTGAMIAASSARLRERVAYAAADELFRQISIRNISGHVVVDFPSITSAKARAKFSSHLSERSKGVSGLKSPSFSRSGLYSFLLPRRGLSLLDQLTEFSGGEPVSGRVFTVETAAKMAIWALESALKENTSNTVDLGVGAAIAKYLAEKPVWTSRLEARYGARFEISENPALKERAFDCSQ